MKSAYKKSISISDFKAKALAYVAEVEETGQELLITRHGEPVAKVIPFTSVVKKLGGSLKGLAKITGDLEIPVELWSKYKA